MEDAASATAAAWGDPAIVLRCGVGEPASFDQFSTCQIVNGVAWYIPDEQITSGRPGATVTADVHCGTAPLGWTLLHEAWEWLEANLFF